MTKRQIYKALHAVGSAIALAKKGEPEKVSLALDVVSCTLTWSLEVVRALEAARKRLQEAKANDTAARAVAFELVKLLEG